MNVQQNIRKSAGSRFRSVLYKSMPSRRCVVFPIQGYSYNICPEENFYD